MADMPAPSTAAIDALLQALTDVIKGANSPDIQAAQALLLRRLALEGSVIPSRLPAPRNITELGGYVNLLTSLGQDDMRTQMLGSVLGVAGGSPIPGWDTAAPPLALVAVANDRPNGPAGIPVAATVSVRGDFAPAVESMLASVHAAGGLLPLWSPPPVLPLRTPGTAPQIVPDPMLHLGRALWVAPTAALVDPVNDPVIVGRAASDTDPGFRTALRVNAGTPGAPEADWTALRWDPGSKTFVDHHLGPSKLLPIETALAPAGFTPAAIPARPTVPTDYAWARLTNVTGLIPGLTRLGEELSLVHPPSTIASSVFAGMLGAVWDGVRFAPVA